MWITIYIVVLVFIQTLNWIICTCVWEVKIVCRSLVRNRYALRARSRKAVKDIIVLNGNVMVFRPAVLRCSNGAWIHNTPGARLSWRSSWFLRMSWWWMQNQCCCRTVAGLWALLLPYGCGFVSSVATVRLQGWWAVLLPYGCGLVSSVATVRLRVGERCCYRTAAGWQWAVLLPYVCGLAGLLE